MKVYVEAQSKADLIRRLSAGEEITGYNYSMFGGGGHYMLDNTLEDGTIIAIYSQMSQGNPVAKSWGTWTNGVLKAESFEAPKICWECNKEWEYGSRDKSHSNFCHDCSPRPETFESPVSCKICGKTFASFRGLNGHMNAHLPSHRKRAEYGELPPVSCKICGKTFDGFHELADHTAIHHPESRRFEAESFSEAGLELRNAGRCGCHQDDVWEVVNVESPVFLCGTCGYAGNKKEDGHFGAVFGAELSEHLPYQIITTDWKSSIAPEHRPNNDNWFITGDIIFAVPDREGDYGRGEETIVRISTYGEGTTLDEAKENGIQKATEYLYDDYSRGYFTQNAETFEADEPSIVRGTWGSGVVEFSNGEVFVKVITFPVTDDSGLGGESMWVILEEGNEFEGIGILDNDPIHSDIKVGSRIKFTGGNTHYKPHFVAVVQNMEAEGDEQTIEDFFVSMSDLLTTYSGGDWDWDSEAHDGVLEFSGHLTPTNGSNFYQYDLDFDEMREDVEPFYHPPLIESTNDTRKNNFLKVVGAVVIGLFIGRNL